MNRRDFLRAGAAASLSLIPTVGLAQDDHDLVLAGGRVIDPETRTDARLNVGIRNGKIASVSRERLSGRRTIDVSGLVVAPGFIDVLAHGMDLENNRYQAHDGVTTVLALEGETADVDSWYAEREGKMLLNYGASAGHGAIRSKIVGQGKSEDTDYREATPRQVMDMKNLACRAMDRGALALGFGLEYTPGASHAEVIEMFGVASVYGATCHVHTRFGTLNEPDNNLAAVEEVLAASELTGAPLHIVHVPSMALKNTPQVLRYLGMAQARGVDVTACCYPYTAFGTGLNSAVFDPGWQQRFGIDYGDLQWAATGERLTAETFERYRKQGGFVIAYAIPETAVRAAVASDVTMIGSDGGLSKGKGHPRSAGTYARVLGHYCRELKDLTLMVALMKMTYWPARRLERRAPAMRAKGRIRPGADADITVFDADRIIDRATFDDPSKPSEGVRYLFVGGAPVISDGALTDTTMTGKPVRAPMR